MKLLTVRYNLQELGICDYAERVDCTKPPKIFQVPKNVLPQVTDGKEMYFALFLIKFSASNNKIEFVPIKKY